MTIKNRLAIYFTGYICIHFFAASYAEENPLTDFSVRLRWTASAKEDSSKKSSAYSSFKRFEIYGYVCKNSAVEKIELPFTREIRRLKRIEFKPEVEGCSFLDVFEYQNEGVLDRTPSLTFSVIDFYRRGLKDLNAQSLDDVQLVLFLARYGTNFFHPGDVQEFIGLSTIDFLYIPENATSMHNLRAAEGQGDLSVVVDASVVPRYVLPSSAFYDLNVPYELYRPSVMRWVLGKSVEEPLRLRDYLNMGNLFYSSQKNSAWAYLSSRISEINPQSPQIKDLVGDPQVKKLLTVSSKEALSIYLYFYRASLEDAQSRTLVIQEKIKNDQANRHIIDGKLVLTDSAQEELARYQLQKAKTQDAIAAFEIITQSARGYLDNLLR